MLLFEIVLILSTYSKILLLLYLFRCLALSWFMIIVFQIRLGRTKHVIIVFETFSLLTTSVVNKSFHLTFVILNTRHTVILADDKFLVKFFSCAERVGLNMYGLGSHFDSRIFLSSINIGPTWCTFTFTFGSNNTTLLFTLWYSVSTFESWMLSGKPVAMKCIPRQLLYWWNITVFANNNDARFRKMEL